MTMDWMKLTDTQLWEWIVAHPIAGGRQDEPEPPGPEPAPEPAPAEPDAPVAKQYMIDGKPVARWDEIYGRYTQHKHLVDQYSAFGDPTELQTKLDKLKAYDTAIEQARARGNSNVEEQEETEKIRRQFFKLFPEMREVMESRTKLNGYDELRGQLEDLALDRASQRFGKVLESRKLDMKYQDQLEDLAMSQMTEQEKTAMLRGDLSILDEVLERLPSDFLAKFAATPSAPPPPPKRIGGVATPPAAPASGKPKTLKDAHDGAYKALQAMSG